MRALASLLICLGLAVTLAACGGGSNSTSSGAANTAGVGGSNTASAAGGAGVSSTSSAAALPDTMDLGNPHAKVTVNEFASLGCPICAKWNNEVFETFKTKYIDTGRVHYVLHEFLTGDQPVAAAGFLLARCAGKDAYFKVADAVFRQEAPLLESDQNAAKRDVLVKIAQSLGMTEQQFDACVSDDASLTALNNRSEAAAKQYNIESTPTFVIGNQTLVGYQDMAAIDKAIAAAGGS